MRLMQKMTCLGICLASTGFMAPVPVQAILVQHNGSTILSDDLQGHTTNLQPGSPWQVLVEARDPSPSGFDHGTLYSDVNDLDGNVLVTDLDGIGVFPGAPDVVDGHTKYLHMDNTGDRPYVGVNFGDISSGELYIEFMLHETTRRVQMQVGNNFAEGESFEPNIKLTPASGTGGNTGAESQGWDLNQPGMPDGRFLIHIDSPYGEWYKVGLLYDLDDAEFELFINDVSGGVVEIVGGSAASSVNQFIINQSNNTDGDIFVGSTVPEPASLALLGMGGLLMLRRRKV